MRDAHLVNYWNWLLESHTGAKFIIPPLNHRGHTLYEWVDWWSKKVAAHLLSLGIEQLAASSHNPNQTKMAEAERERVGMLFPTIRIIFFLSRRSGR